MMFTKTSWWLGAMVLAASCLLSEALGADNCVIRRLPDIPVTFIRGRPAVPVGLNGQRVLFMLDTGFAKTTVTPATQTRLALPLDTRSQAKGVGAGGALAVPFATVRTFEFNELALTNQVLPVVGVDKPFGAAADDPDLFAGVIGGDLLLLFEVELDFPNKLARLYLRPDCYEPRPSWTAPYTTIQARRTSQAGLVVPVKVNGTPLRGLVDTGASETVLTLAAASGTGIDAAALRNDKTVATSGAAGLSTTAWLHQVRTLDIGAEHLTNQSLLIQDFKLPDADMLIGEPFIESHRIWLSYTAARMFVQAPRAK